MSLLCRLNMHRWQWYEELHIMHKRCTRAGCTVDLVVHQ